MIPTSTVTADPLQFITVTMADPFTRDALREALRLAIHEHRGPLFDLVQDVLADTGVVLVDCPRCGA